MKDIIILAQHACLYIKDFMNIKEKQDIYKIEKYIIFLQLNVLKKNELKIVLVDEFKLENKEQLLKEENKYIQKYFDDKYCLNSLHAIFNLEKRKQYMDKYNSEYYKENSIKLKEYQHEYNTNNKEKIAKNTKMYRENNKEIIKEKKSKKYTCICESTITIDHKLRHEKSKKHLNFINSQK